MTLEERIVDALHQADHYQPSVDLFARVSRSIEDDRRHRRRVRRVIAGLAGLAAGLGGLLGVTAGRAPTGLITWPAWALQIALVVILGSVLAGFGPAIRRLGRPLLDDVFHLSPQTGERFARLLDIAYYLAFGGGILLSLNLVGLSDQVAIGGEAFASLVLEAANYLLLLGLAHVANLLLLPFLGLFYSSVVRRVRRRVAGRNAPVESRGARQADRVVTWVMAALVAGTTVVVLTMIGLVISGL
jgi:hypothetical protein